MRKEKEALAQWLEFKVLNPLIRVRVRYADSTGVLSVCGEASLLSNSGQLNGGILLPLPNIFLHEETKNKIAS